MVLALAETPEEKKKREESEAKLKAGEQKQAMREEGTTTGGVKTKEQPPAVVRAVSQGEGVKIAAKNTQAETLSEPETYLDSEPNFGIPIKIKAKARLKNMTPMERDEFKRKLYGEKDLAKRSQLLADLAK